MNHQSSYPLSGVPSRIESGRGGTEVFDAPEALEINRARMQHLDSLQLPLDGKSVLDVGCGVGHLAPFFLERRCRVTCIDGRAENIDTLKRRLPGVQAHVARVDADPLTRFGRFDIVFCYGLLYHLENPVAGLRNLASVCDQILLLETVISDHELPVVRLEDEPASTTNQALDGVGCRPTPSFVAMALTRAGFGFVYAPATPPDHPDFRFAWVNNLECARDNHLLRCIFVASRHELGSSQLNLIFRAPSGRKSPTYFLPTAGAPARRVWLDVGAHLGEKTLAEAEKDPNLRVYAFEPNVRVAAQCMGRLPNFVVLPVAIAEQNGSADFYISVPASASSLLPFVPEGIERWVGKERLRVERTVTAPTMRLDTFLDEVGIERVEFLNIRAQGAGLAVLKSCGGRLRDIDRIEIEAQIAPISPYRDAASKDSIIRYLEEAGFELESSELQTYGQEEKLVFVPALSPDCSVIAAEARDLSFVRPLEPRPDWHFGDDWDNADALFQRRRRIWSYCNRRALDLPLEFAWYSGLTLTLYLGNDTSRALFIGGAIDPNEFAFLDRFLRPGMVMIDAGANEGLYAVFAAQRVGSGGRVLAFEPSTRELERLKLNLVQNSLRNVEAYQLALCEAEGTGTLRVAASGHSGQNTLGDFIYKDVGLLREERVAVRTLDATLAESRVDRLDLLKLDVEGSETRLVRGAANSIRKHRPALLLEISDDALRKQSSSSEELLQLVRSFGYLLYVFDSHAGLPRRAQADETGANMIAVPAERPLPSEWCAPAEQRLSGKLQALTGKSILFDLRDHRVFNNSQVSGKGPISVSTRPEQWSFAVGFPVKEPARRKIGQVSDIVVRMEADIETGRIGIGIVDGALSQYLAPELQFDSSQKVDCEIATSYLPPGSILIVRNTAADGVISKAVIRSLSTFVVHDAN